MYFEAHPAIVVEHDRHRKRRSYTQSRENTGAEALRESRSGHSGADAEEAASPSPPGDGGEFVKCRKRLAPEQMDEQHSNQARQIDEHGGAQQLPQRFPQFRIGGRLGRICSARGNRKDINDPVHAYGTRGQSRFCNLWLVIAGSSAHVK